MLAEKKGNWRAYVYILIGTAVMAVSITSIYDHMQMVTGGFSGLAIIIKSLTENLMPGGIPLWLTNAAGSPVRRCDHGGGHWLYLHGTGNYRRNGYGVRLDSA